MKLLLLWYLSIALAAFGGYVCGRGHGRLLEYRRMLDSEKKKE